MSAPTISHPTGRPNYSEVSIGAATYAFSYQTCIGVDNGSTRVCRENVWGPTTGKHLNYFGGLRDNVLFNATIDGIS